MRAIYITVLTLLITGCGGGPEEDPGPAPEPAVAVKKAKGPIVRIGMLFPTSERRGQRARDGVELALQSLAKRKKVDFTYDVKWEHSKGEAATTIAAMEAFAADSDVLAVVGPLSPEPAAAAAAVANEQKVPLITPMTSPRSVTAPDYLFRTWPSDAAESAFIARHGHFSARYDRAVVLHVNTSVGQSYASGFSDEFQSIGGSVVDTISYEEDANALDATIKKVRAAKADVIFFAGSPPDIPEVLQSLSAAGNTLPVLSTSYLADPSVVSEKGLEGVVFPYPETYSKLSNARASKYFASAFQTAHGAAASVVSAESHDAMMLLDSAIVDAMGSGDEIPTRDQVRDALDGIVELKGASGVLRLDANGDAKRSFNLYSIKDGEMSRVSER